MAGVPHVGEGFATAPQIAPAPEPGICIELKPRCLLTPRSARQFFGVTALITFFVAACVALQGAWPVLLFAGLEMGVLYVALQCSLGRARDYERVEISEDRVRIRACMHSLRTETSFVRHWARVRVEPSESALHPNRLFIECQGRRCELGAFLTDAERTDTAARLQRLIGTIGQSPALDLRPSPLT